MEHTQPPIHSGTLSEEALNARLQNAALPDEQCVVIIGMAGAGKTTIGRLLANLLGWAHVDSDNLIEAVYGTRLQNIADALTKEGFLDLESKVICSTKLKRCVLSTGGSVVYRPKAVEHLRSMGPLVYIAVDLPVILERIDRKPDRGLAIAPGQTVEDLFHERRLLYETYADVTVQGGIDEASLYARSAAFQLLRHWGL